MLYRLKKGDDQKALGKAPAISGWKTPGVTTCFEELKIDGTRQNAGLLTGDITGLIVVDVDDVSLFSQKHKIPDTFTVSTGKGFHHYFRIPEDRLNGSLKSSVNKSDGFDIRANGGYVVAPGSVHAETRKTYTIIDESVPIAEVPEWVLTWASKGKEPKQEAKREQREGERVFVEIEQLDIPRQYLELLESSSTKPVDRSKKLWILIKQMVSDGCEDDVIISAVHYSSGDINAKYSEKGANRVNWLLEQIDRARIELSLVEQEVVTKVTREHWVEEILSATLRTLVDEHHLIVFQGQREALKGMIRLYVGILEGSINGWFNIPLGVGTGKTTVIKHVLLFLWHHRHELADESITVAVQKIDQITDIEQFLLSKGVDKSFFAVIHSRRKDLKEAKREANEKRVVIVTHQRMNSLSFIEKFFTYKGKRRTLLIYDEQISNGISNHCDLDEILSMFEKFDRRLGCKHVHIPFDIMSYLKEVKSTLMDQQKTLMNGEGKVQPITLPSKYIAGYEHYELLKIGRMIDSELLQLKEEEINWISLILTLGKIDGLEKDICLYKSADREDKKDTVVVFSATEMLSNEIRNLITTDATRSFNRLFRYTTRTDLKTIQIYQLKEFRTYEGLRIHYTTLRSGRQFIQEVFSGKVQMFSQKYPWLSENIFIDLIAEVIKANPDKKTLIFHSKQLEDSVKDKLGLSLLSDKVYDTKEDYYDHVKFRTFGMHDATNLFSDCSNVIFLGLHRPKRRQFLADLYAETLDMNLIEEYMVREVELGYLTVQLQQGTGRGTMRRGEEQDVYFFDLEPERFIEDFQKAFPGCSIVTWEPECLKVGGALVTAKPSTTNKKHKDPTERQRILDFYKAARKKGVDPEPLVGPYLSSGKTPVKFLNSLAIA